MLSFLEALLTVLVIGNSIITAQSYPFKHEQVSLPSDAYHVRPAARSDVDEIATVLVDAFMPSAGWQYGLLDPPKYAHYTWRCLRDELARFFDVRPPHTFANVIAVPNEDILATRSERVVAVGAWKEIYPSNEHPEINFTQVFASSCAKHLDWNHTRVEDFNRQMNLAEEKYIYGLNESQMNLHLLATHPDWDGHGFGAMNVQWGMQYAAKKQWPVTLLSSPAGYPLYDSLGFRSEANVTIDMLDNLGELWFEYMRLDA